MRLLFRLPVLALLLAEEVSSHGALVKPPGRNAVDRFLPQFAGGTSPMTSCNCGDQRNGCEQGIRAAGGGQPCLWFSQGCTIGCSMCTGIGSHSDYSLCNDSTVTATLPKYAWTMNRNVTEGSAQDSYAFNPWRAPGSAPVNDEIGRAHV